MYGERKGSGYKVVDHLLYFKLKVYGQVHVGTGTKYITCSLFLFVRVCV